MHLLIFAELLYFPPMGEIKPYFEKIRLQITTMITMQLSKEIAYIIYEQV